MNRSEEFEYRDELDKTLDNYCKVMAVESMSKIDAMRNFAAFWEERKSRQLEQKIEQLFNKP
jgi:hypothetical protein